MKRIDLTKSFVFVLILLLCVVVFYIIRFNTNEQDSRIFSRLDLIESAKYFPSDKTHIVNCVDENCSECAVLGLVLKAKADLFSRGAETALKKTLGVIETACSELESTGKSWPECFGAITAIYFFSSPKEDSIIFKFFESNPKLLYKAIHQSDYAWFYNRPSIEKWNSLVESRLAEKLFDDKLKNPFTKEKPSRVFRIELLNE